MKKLKFITIEGGDGAGKSTFIPIIKNYLESLGQNVVLTREPGGTGLGEKLRDLILTHRMDLTAETLLMFAARAQHVADVINPALEDENTWVICDRFTDSTYAYQCAGKGFPEGSLRQLENMVQSDLRPGITFVFDVPLHISKARLAKTGKVPDKFESEDDDFKERVNKGYKTLVKQQLNRCKLIDSSQTIEDTKEQVLFHLQSFVQELSVSNSKKNKVKP
ncbi:dTMP kinase [archaeon]|nr:dTMP kinase [archaeon]